MRPFFGRRIQDTPIIKTSFVDFDAIRPPISSQSTNIDCKSGITHPDETYGPSQLYFGFYQPSPGVFFYEYNEPDEMMDLIIMVLVVNDDNYTLDQPVQAIIVIKAFDSDYDPLTKYYKEKRYYESTTPEAIKSTSSYDNSIITMNLYALVLNQEFIRPSWMNDFGIPPIYENKSHIESTLIMIMVHPMGNTVQINKEVRHHTVTWGLAAAVYALLFAEQNELTRIDSFELFLQEYVVDVHYLNGIRDKLAKPRATSTSTNDAAT
ncbi:hypothetical protein C1646_762784 [Rhizophagus diaphanus]|nr:hypothetical protein C1646_762784 [Rhizophagus diaphanus] [Rhizophagus sp. MUCL 43196]